MNLHKLFQKIIQKIEGKYRWFEKYKYPELQNLVQYLGILSLLCKPMTVSQKSAMIVAPHQDDESFGCAGVIALKCQQGIPVYVVFTTNGAGSHSWHPQFKSGEIVPIRRQEALTALGILGVKSEHIYFLDQPDGRLKYDPQTRQQAMLDLTQLIQTLQPGEIYVTHRQDHSADHEATYSLTQEAIAATKLDIDLYEYYIWLLWKKLIGQDVKLSSLAGAYRLSIAAVIAQKKQAILTYRSQYSVFDGGRALPPGFLNRFFLPYEVFFKP